MHVIGISGNSGAGKSTVSTIMKNNLNALIIDADSLVKKNQKPGNEYYSQMVELFGEEILKSDGTINRGAVSNKIYTDDSAREKLNILTFACVKRETQNLLEQNADRDFVVLDFPLLFEGHFDEMCDAIVVVVADNETKINRIMQRDKITRRQAASRLASQKSEEFLKSKADYIVDNSSKVNYGKLVNEVVGILRDIKGKEKKIEISKTLKEINEEVK